MGTDRCGFGELDVFKGLQIEYDADRPLEAFLSTELLKKCRLGNFKERIDSMTSKPQNKPQPSPQDPLSAKPRRYLVKIDSVSTNQLFTDCVVVGAGIAGLRAAIEAAQHIIVIVLCKGTLQESNTWKARKSL